jgi:gamma-glutamylcyclotransferase (GGCT)/AIG2-like uncharacterized protein YtfP
MTTMRFFVIGSWTEGMLHFQKLRPFIISYETATTKGQVYRLPAGIPVIVDEGNDEIVGQLIELKYDGALIALMDAFHGVHNLDPAKGLHQRTEIQIQKASGQVENAQIYLFNPKKLTNKAQKIAGTVWAELLREEPPISEQLTERQRTYVLKLGAAKGRDIIPINDLTLYRELMKLELIVDKGRRLALSSLGKEVYNHLI